MAEPPTRSGPDPDTASPAVPPSGSSERRPYEVGELVFAEGDACEFAYVIVDGRIELTKDVRGTEILLAEIGAGDMFGEMGLIDGNPRSASARALEATTLDLIGRDQLMQRLSSDASFAAPVVTQLVSQLRDTSNRLAHEQALSLQRAADSAEVIAPVGLSAMARLRGFFNTDVDFIEFQPAAVEIERQRTPAIAIVTLYVILGLIVSAFTWASVSAIDTSVSAFGRVTTEVPNIVVQPSETAVIRTIHVREGDFVEKGRVLATLDATVAEAEAEVTVTRASLASIQAQKRRLEAESADQVLADGFSPDRFSDNRAIGALQLEIFEQRRDGLRQRLASFDEQKRQIDAEIRTNTQDARDLGTQAEVLAEIEAMQSEMMDKGAGSRVNYLNAKNQRLSVNREQRRLLSSRTRMRHQLEALRADRQAMLAGWKSQVAEELVKTRRERERVTEELTKTEHRESLVRLVAPAPGVILAVADRSVGSVIRQAEQMFTIVPANVPMEMEVDVQPKDVGLIQVGDVARIKLDALPFQKHGVITGRVRLISEDAVETEGGASQSVYRSRVALGERNLRDVPASFRLTPGLTGSADITTGKRRVITYFIYPVVRALSSSFHEQ